MYNNYKSVYFNEDGQKVWRTTATAAIDAVQYEYIGKMTQSEYELLIETLFELYEDDRISLEAFMRIFGDIRSFCDHIKNIVQDS